MQLSIVLLEDINVRLCTFRNTGEGRQLIKSKVEAAAVSVVEGPETTSGVVAKEQTKRCWMIGREIGRRCLLCACWFLALALSLEKRKKQKDKKEARYTKMSSNKGAASE